MKRAAALLLLTGLLWAAPRVGHADELGQAIARYHRGDFEEAVTALQRVAARLGPGPRRARAHLFRGLALAVLGRWTAAREAFAAALTDDPEIRPNRDRVRPSIVAAFEAVRATVRGILEVRSARPASVALDGKPVGRTPLRRRLPVGRYDLQVRTDDGFAEYRQAGVLIRAGATVRIDARLVPRIGKVTLRSQPPGAGVYLGKRRLATTPVVGLPLRAGTRHLVVRLPGYRDSPVEVLVNPELPAELRVTLSPVPARPWYKRKRAWAWVTGGLSGGLLVTGLAFGIAARSAASELQEGWARGGLPWDQEAALRSAADSRARTANILFGVTGAVAVTSLVLFLLGDDPPGRERPRVSLTPGGVVLSGRF